MLRRVVLFVALLLTISTSSAMAQDPPAGDRTDQWAISANDPLAVEAGENLAIVVGIHNQVRIDGEVNEFMAVIDGDATINGTVYEVLVISGTLTLGPNARVHQITLVRSELTQQPGSVVTGGIESQSTIFFLEWWNSPIFSLIAWLILTLFLIAGGVLFALAAGRQVPDLASAPNRHILANIITSAILWITLPIFGVLVMLTIIGIPLGLVLFGLVLPGIWWLGYTVIGARLGLSVLRLLSVRGHTVLATFLGLLALQLTSLVPYVGGTIIFWSGVYGSGALLYHVTRARRDRPIDPELAAYGGPEWAGR